MTALDLTVALFCQVDDAMPEAQKHPLAALHPSEVVTLGLLHALRGEGTLAFYRWLLRELKPLFLRLPERTRCGKTWFCDVFIAYLSSRLMADI